jgi:hypothetical protein
MDKILARMLPLWLLPVTLTAAALPTPAPPAPVPQVIGEPLEKHP